MLKHLRWCSWGIVLSVVFSTVLSAQTNFVYTNNDIAGANSVSAFSVDKSSLCATLGHPLPCQISGSPFLTGGHGHGTGGFYSANRIIVVKGSQNDFLYVSNAGGSDCYFGPTVSAFKIDANSGALSLVPPPSDPACPNGSTFPTDGFDGNPSGTSLAATPDGQYLYVGTTAFGTITVFRIDPTTGALSNQGSVFTGGPMSSMKVTPQKVKVGANDEYLLAVALSLSNEVAMFEIKSDGMLVELPGSPFSTLTDPIETTSNTQGIDINCASNLLFAGRFNSPYVDVFNFSTEPDGTLTVSGLSPLETNSRNNQVVVLVHPDDGTPEKTLFSSNSFEDTVTALTVGSDGSLAIDGTPASIIGSAATSTSSSPSGLAVSKDGKFLYAADADPASGSVAISTFDLISSPPITPLPSTPTPTGSSVGLHSLATYPPNVCSITNGGTTPKLTVTKILIPKEDPRRFNLQINGTTWATNVGDGGSTGAQEGEIGPNTVGETVGTPGSSLSDFNVVIGGDCAADGTITLAADDNKTCAITNTRKMPTLTSIDPATAIVGSPGFSMSLTGTNFGADSTAQFDGSDLTTHYTNPDTTHLTADIPASDLMTVGRFPISVHNLLTTVGSSNSLTLTVSYKFLGLLAPYAAPPRLYRVNSSIPLRWQYATADGTPTPSPDASPVVKIYPAAGCGEASAGEALAIEAAGDSGYRYHQGSMTWQFNLKTGNGVGAGCYVIYIKSLQTGQTDGPFPIQLRK